MISKTSKSNYTSWNVDFSKDSTITDYHTRFVENGAVDPTEGFDLKVASYRKYQYGWFPQKWSLSSAPGGPRTITPMEVAEIVFNPDLPASMFEVPKDFLKPGMVVWDGHAYQKVARDGKLVPMNRGRRSSQ
jgi:hypothetical protein